MSRGSTQTRPTALLLHGVPTSPALWQGVVDELVESGLSEDRLRVLRPCLPGYAGAPALPSWELGTHLAWLEEEVRRLGLHSPAELGSLHLVGQDYGGLLAAAWAARHGAASLTLTSTAIGLAWLPARVTAWPGLRAFFYRRYQGRLWLSQGVEDEAREAFLATFEPLVAAHPDLARQMEATARGLELTRLLGLPAALRAARVPTLALWGAGDRFLPVAHAQALVQSLPLARLVVLPRGRHFLPWEQAPAYAAALRDHWRHADPSLG